MAKYNKATLIERIADANSISKAEAERAINYTLEGIELILEDMKPKDKLQLVGNLTFEVVDRPARQGHNPKTKEKLTIPAKKVVKVKAGMNFQQAIEQ